MKIDIKIDFSQWKLMLLSNVNNEESKCYLTFTNISDDTTVSINGSSVPMEAGDHRAEVLNKILTKGDKKCVVTSNGVSKEFVISTEKDFAGTENLFMRIENGIYKLGQCYEDMTLGKLYQKEDDDKKELLEKMENYLPKAGGTVSGNLFLQKGFNVSSHNAGSGQAGYLKIATIKIASTYANVPIIFEILRRGDLDLTRIIICFSNSDSMDPGLSLFEYESRKSFLVRMVKTAAGTWDLYVQKAEAYEYMTVMDIKKTFGYMSNVTIALKNEFATSLPAGTDAVNRYDTGWNNVSYGNGISTYSGYPQGAVRRCGKVVELNAVVTNSTEWTEHNSIITIPSGYRPSRYKHFICQGSGSNRFLLTVQGDGKCLANRYSNNTTMSNKVPKGSWLCLHGTWITDQ